MLPLGTGAGQFNVVNIGAQISGNPNLFQFDEDYFAVNLRAGDILDAALTSGPTSRGWDVALFDANGSEIIGSTGNITRQTLPAFSAFPTVSPYVDTTSLVTFAQVIPATGRYYVRIGDALGAYSLRLRAMREPIEIQPIGTKQIVFLDFDGATINGGIFQVPGTRRLPSMINTLSQYGFLPSQENEIIDKLIAKIKELLRN